MKMSKQQIILLYGGRSAERKVSVLSAESVMHAINYDKFFVKGEVHTMADEAYTSDNTNRLDVDGTVQKILGTDYVQEALKEAGR